jgi:aspartyl-tRNA(Asn)/glutamyl-tRNA(Gln) amidotransferase subunit B
MNSFAFLEQGIKAEIERQIAIKEGGDDVVQETLHFDPVSGRITSLRSKEEAHDYRYFPEPDLVPIAITNEMLEGARAALPELPAARAERYEADLGISSENAKLLAFRPELAEFFDEAQAADGVDAQALSAFLLNTAPQVLGAEPPAVAKLVRLVGEKTVTPQNARVVLERLVEGGGDPEQIVQSEGLGSIGGGDELDAIVDAALAANADAAAKIKDGNMKAIGPIIGFVMKETKGRADGGEVTTLVRAKLGL